MRTSDPSLRMANQAAGVWVLLMGASLLWMNDYQVLILGTVAISAMAGVGMNVLLGLSGGIDSALVLAIAVDALGLQRASGATVAASPAGARPCRQIVLAGPAKPGLEIRWSFRTRPADSAVPPVRNL